MVGKVVHTSAAELVRYHEQHLSNGDYHLEEGKVRGEFIGALADEWGLNDKPIVRDDPKFRAFAKLDISSLIGRKLLRPRKSERQAVEFAYSAPKSVSIAAVNDLRIAQEMSASVKEELKWFERFACCRDRRGELYNSEAARRTGKMLAAAFVHETSRAKDPSLHMHVLIANFTIDPERNEALAMSYGEMFEMRKTLDARIHNNLARRLSALGYTVEVAEHGFRLRDIPAPIEEIYSVRNREIATAKELLREGYTVQQLGDALRDRPVKEKSELWVSGRIRELLGAPKLPSDRSIDEHDLNEQAWLVTRRPKEIATTAELKANVETTFRESGFEMFVAPEARSEPAVSMDLEKVISQGGEAVFERESIVRVDHLVGEIVRLAPGQAANSQIEAALEDNTEFVRKKVGDHEMITTRAIISEEEAIINKVKAGTGKKAALIAEAEYQTPDELRVTYDGLARILADARMRGEEMTSELAALWLQQHEAVNKYVMTSTDQFLNIRGGAGVGKTYFMERLVRASVDAGRPVALLAPYGEQSRVTLRSEAERVNRLDVVEVFRGANTVAWLLNKAGFSPGFRESLQGGDIYVDEASLLDNRTMLELLSLANGINARIIFQGDTQQLPAVGRGQPLAMLEREIGFGMGVGRISVTRRQLKLEDKRIAQELSSGDAARFSAAIETLIGRSAIRRGGITEAVEAILAKRNAKMPVETIVLSSTHRLAEKVSDKLHEAYKKAGPGVTMAQVAALKPKELQPAELLSTASYKPGEMIEFQPDGHKPVRMAEVLDVTAEGVRVKGQLRGAKELVSFEKVAAVYERTTLERGPGEVLLLTQKIKADGKTYENGSRQAIVAIDSDKMRFESGLELRLDDGRVRQGDAVTTYKAQGASKIEMIRVEDNRSLLAMANREDLHVAFTRHRANARMFVQDIDVLRQVANRSLIKDLTARDLEARKIASFVEQIEQALFKAARFVKTMTKAAKREHERIRELYLRKRREKTRVQSRERSREREMAM
ncbi:MAG: relaxase domain-containing protein [Verrucomicrobia bacterium]|nr:relaxase domain-containing protein [Verrucomicrobiota bacterium]